MNLAYRACADNLIYPLTTLTHRSQTMYGKNATEFNPCRWEEGPASSTVGQGYLPFGFGRWACPGRILAVTGKYIGTNNATFVT